MLRGGESAGMGTGGMGSVLGGEIGTGMEAGGMGDVLGGEKGMGMETDGTGRVLGGEMGAGMGPGAIGGVLIGERGLGWLLAGQEGRQKADGRRWSRHTGEDLRRVRGLNMDSVGEELVG